MKNLKFQSVFDIIGPVMVGPSSSHTAGAVRIGKIVSAIFGETPTEVEFQLLNSNGSITFRFSSEHLPTTIDFDFNHPFDPLYPPKVLVMDMDGKETILLPEENDLF